MIGLLVDFVWGGSVPLPPPLAEGWRYEAKMDDWLLVHSPGGAKFFVACIEGDYCLYRRRRNAAGEFYVDPDTVLPLPVADRPPIFPSQS
jgi:hypothetical protein